jgi:hypothetical protein
MIIVPKSKHVPSSNTIHEAVCTWCSKPAKFLRMYCDLIFVTCPDCMSSHETIYQLKDGKYVSISNSNRKYPLGGSDSRW